MRGASLYLQGWVAVYLALLILVAAFISSNAG